MGGKLGQCRCTEPHTPTGYVCETCGGMEYREAHGSAPAVSEVSREPISAERWHQENRHKFLTGETVYPYGHSKEKIEYLDEVAMLRAYAHSLTTQNEKEK